MADDRVARARTDGRREELVLAAFQALAERGFEGLRTREVAAQVGINPATLHYYFPTKEALIGGVLHHVTRRFGRLLGTQGTAADQLRHHLAATRRMILEEPATTAVLCELALRGPRDPAIATMLRKSDDAWYGKVRGLIERAVAEHALPADVDPASAAALLVSVVRGLCMPGGSAAGPERVERAFSQLERCLGLR
jgi:AcrR family transcriptional regulator